MHSDVNELFQQLWLDYLKLTPSAAKVHQLLGGGQAIINDHIALRTFNRGGVGLAVLAAHFEALGYVSSGDYVFTKKKLIAKHFEHANPRLPKVFISELLVEQCSPELGVIVDALLAQMQPAATTADNFLYSGRHWHIDSASYQALLAESEYAAWVAAFGYRANHFTVSINDLAGFNTVAEVNSALKQAGFILNSVGGEIKGDREVMLEQSATMADVIEVAFSDKTLAIPSCFYEFALRYPKANGDLYTGFVEASADKIFESTNAM
ncbi:MAG: DUF1338 domain-containing protein [Shewanella sp.]